MEMDNYMRILENLSMTYDYEIDWKRFRHTTVYISECLGNRWFVLESNGEIIGLIDDQMGVFVIFTDVPILRTVLEKMYNLPDVVSYEAYGYSKCDDLLV